MKFWPMQDEKMVRDKAKINLDPAQFKDMNPVDLKRMLGSFDLIYKHGRRIVDHSKEGCQFCKITNISQHPFKVRKFESNHWTHTIKGVD
jgi:hypothetical protein